MCFYLWIIYVTRFIYTYIDINDTLKNLFKICLRLFFLIFLYYGMLYNFYHFDWLEIQYEDSSWFTLVELMSP